MLLSSMLASLRPLLRLALLLVLLAGVPTLLARAAHASPASAAPSAAPSASPSTAPSTNGRVIVLGFDGADARTVAELMDAGELPNLAKLRAQGSFAPLLSSVPNESAASWACLNSGQNPAKTGVQGFVKRTNFPSGPQPDLGLRDIEDRELSAMELHGLLGKLAPLSRPLVAALAGLGVLLCFVVVFSLLMRLRARISIPLALALGLLGAWTGWIVRGYVPEVVVEVCGNPMAVGGFWEESARAGVPTVVIDGAMSWDREPVPGARVLCGLGVPDVRGQNGDWFVYTSDPAESARAPDGRPTSTAGTVFRVDEHEGRIESAVFGPRDLYAIDRLRRELADVLAQRSDTDRGYAELAELDERKRALEEQLAHANEQRLSLPLVAERKDAGRWRVTIGEHAEELGEGEWSGWYRLAFDVNPLIKVHALTRAKLVHAAEPFELFVDILQIDPEEPPFWQPVSQPAAYSGQLSRLVAQPFETVGWACLTMPYKDEEIDVQTFLDDIDFTRRWREELMLAALAKDDWRCFFGVESTVDRVQHMLYSAYDPQHPQHDAARAAQAVRYDGRDMPLSEVIPAAYRAIDRFVGRVMDEHLRPGDTLLLCADHGFQSFRRQVNINNWLAEKGWLVLREGTTKTVGLGFVDWTRTKAYSLGLGMIFLNLKGREAGGIVEPADAPALVDEIGRALLELKDEDGTPACLEFYAAREVHSGPHFEDEADLYTGFAPHYRVSWRTTLGGIRLERTPEGGREPGPVFEDNGEPWSGDHVSMARSVVPGIFFSSRKVELPAGGVDLLDIAPSALALLGVTPPASYDHAPLRFVE